jgi:hypothetical protein
MPTRITPCCTDPQCTTYRQILEFLAIWGLDRELKKDGLNVYFEATAPEYWSKRRMARFRDSLRRLPRSH